MLCATYRTDWFQGHSRHLFHMSWIADVTHETTDGRDELLVAN